MTLRWNVTSDILRNVTPSPVPHRRIFGPFLFDGASGQIWKHGVPVKLHGQPLDILTTLLDQPGQIVSREELQRRLWKESTFVDFEHGLNVAINRLRQALGDSADQPRYVETLPGRGYRFVAPVRDSGAPPGPVLVMPPETAKEEPSPSAPPDRRWLWPGLAAVVVASVGIGYLVGSRSKAPLPPPPLRLTVAPPTGYFLRPSSSRQSFALSPDGARLAFSAMDAGGNFRSFAQDLPAGTARPIASGGGTFSLFWADDGRSLLATAAGKLRRTALDSDAYQVVCDLPAITLTGTVIGPQVLIWARSGNFSVPVSGGTPQPVKEHYPWPQLLPDGRHLLYTAFDERVGRYRARMVEFGQPQTTRDLVETDSKTIYAPSLARPGTGYLFALRAGTLLAHPFDPASGRVLGEPLPVAAKVTSFFPTGAADFSAAANGTLAYQPFEGRSQLAWVNRRGEVVRRLGPSGIAVGPGRLSPDGKQIATGVFDVERGVHDLWIFDAVTGAGRRLPDRGSINSPVWSPDSRQLAYALAGSEPPKLFVRASTGQELSYAVTPEYFQEPTDWSGSGRYLAWSNNSSASMASEVRGEFWVTDMAKPRRAFRLSSPSYSETHATFSPDGRWLAFLSDQSGQAELYVQAFEAAAEPRLVGERHLVSRQGAVAIRWRSDGRELFYLGAEGKIYGVPIALSPQFRAGTPALLFALDAEARAAVHMLPGFDVSKDGQRFLIPTVSSSDRAEITVLQNWEASRRGR